MMNINAMNRSLTLFAVIGLAASSAHAFYPMMSPVPFGASMLPMAASVGVPMMFNAYGGYSGVTLPQFLTNSYMNPTPFPSQMFGGGGYFPAAPTYSPYSSRGGSYFPAAPTYSRYSSGWVGAAPAFPGPSAAPWIPTQQSYGNPYLAPLAPKLQPKPAASAWPFTAFPQQPQPASVPVMINPWLTPSAPKAPAPQPSAAVPWPFAVVPQSAAPPPKTPEPQPATPSFWPFGAPAQSSAPAQAQAPATTAPAPAMGLFPWPVPAQAPAAQHAQPQPAQQPVPVFVWPWAVPNAPAR
jgi:hypothetical protein